MFTTRNAVAAILSTMTIACIPGQKKLQNLEPLTGNSFAITDVRVFDGRRATARTNVVVRDGRIASVGRGIPRGIPVIDGSGKTLIPGLIDAHAHIQNEGQLRSAARFGVTTAIDMMTVPAFARSLRGQRDSIVQTPRADLYSVMLPITSPGGMGTQFGIPLTTISSATEADSIVLGRIADGSDYVKIMYEPDAGIVSSISAETLRAVVAAARARGKITVAHVSSLRGARDVVAAGADGLAHLFSDSLIDEALVQEIARRRMFVVPTLTNFAAFEDGPQRRALASDSRLEPFLSAGQKKVLMGPGPGKTGPMAPYLSRFTLGRGEENVRRLHAAGATILAGDDASSDLVPIGPTMHGELEFLVQSGLSPAEAITAATAGPAESFKLSDRGRIEVGARADLVLIDGNPLEDIKATRAIARVFKNGYEVARRIP